jgi:hypothetical protein
MKQSWMLSLAFFAIALAGAATPIPIQLSPGASPAATPSVSGSVDSQDLDGAPGPIAMLLCGAGLLGLGLIGRRKSQV